jgi:predicted dehydrogenase
VSGIGRGLIHYGANNNIPERAAVSVGSQLPNQSIMIRVGVVGAGDIACKVHLPVLLSMPQVRVAWIYDVNDRRAKAAARAYRIPHVTGEVTARPTDCDVALLAIPVGVRRPYFDWCVRNGTAVMAEKPFAAGAAEHRLVADAFPVHRLACGYVRRTYRSTRVLQAALAHGWFGSLLELNVAEGNRSMGSGVDRPYVDDASLTGSGGVLSELGCHWLDLALFLTGAGRYDIKACSLVFDGPVDRKATASVVLANCRHAGGRTVDLNYSVSWLDRQSNMFRLRFETASVWCGPAPGAAVYLGDASHGQDAFRLDADAKGPTTANQAFFEEWQAFLRGLESQQESYLSAHSALLTTSLIENLYQRGRIPR